MASEDLHPDGGDDDYVPTGVRRSTYTPPPSGVIRLGEEELVLDDDLADALERQLADTGAIRIPTVTLTPARSSAPTAAADAAPVGSVPVAPTSSAADEPPADDTPAEGPLDEDDDGATEDGRPRGSIWPEWARADAAEDESAVPFEPLPSQAGLASTVDPVLFPPASELLSRLGDISPLPLPPAPNAVRSSNAAFFSSAAASPVAPASGAPEQSPVDVPASVRDSEQSEAGTPVPTAVDAADADAADADAAAKVAASPGAPTRDEPAPDEPAVPGAKDEPVEVAYGDDGLPIVPARRSLSDAQLLAELAADDNDHASFDRLERQMALRTRELEEFDAWQHAMEDIGSAEALGRIEQVGPHLTGSNPVPVSDTLSADPQAAPDGPTVDSAVAHGAGADETARGGSDTREAATDEAGADRAAEAPETAAIVLPALDELFASPASDAPTVDTATVEPSRVRRQPPTPAEPRAVPAARTPSEAFAQLMGGSAVVPPHGPALETMASADRPELEATDLAPATEAIDMREVQRHEAGETARLLEAEYDAAATGGLWPLEPLPADTPEPSGPPVETLAPVDDERHAALRFEAADEETGTDTAAIVVPVFDLQIEDEVDDIDRAFAPDAIAVDDAGVAVVTDTPAAPIVPVATPRTDDEFVLADSEPRRAPLFGLEVASMEPTALDQRAGRAARLFWIWFAANGSLVSVVLGAGLVGAGLALPQALLALVAGLAVSAAPLAVGALAGKRSGQPTLVVSRATFGLLGNALPAALALITRVVWGGLLLALSGLAIVGLLDTAGLAAGSGLLFAVLAAALVLAATIALFGYALVVAVQTVLAVLSAVLAVGFVALTLPRADLGAAFSGGGSWWLVVSGAALTFAVVGVVWANGTGDLARYQRPAGAGSAVAVSTTLGAGVPVFLLAGWGGLLAASDRALAAAITADPVAALASLVPAPLALVLLAGTALTLVGAVVLSLYSAAFALRAVGARVSGPVGVLVSAALVAVVAALIAAGAFTLSALPDHAITLAVPIATWVGIFGAELLLRRGRVESRSLTRRGGVYPDWAVTNLVALVVVTVLGYAFTSAEAEGLDWQGFGWTLLGLGDFAVAASDVGVFVALVVGAAVPLLIGRGGIRRQERRRH